MAKKEINARIASLRKLREYRQADVAEHLGMKTSTYSQMEQRGNITAEMVIRLSQLFDIDPREILYGEDYETFASVKPGITGLWQVSGRSDVCYADRVALDVFYVKNWSIWMDYYIFFATINAVILRRGAK